MELSFTGRIATKKVTGTAHGVEASVVVSTQMYADEFSVDELAQFLPARRVHLRFMVGDKQVAELDGRLVKLTAGTKKTGSFCESTWAGPPNFGLENLDSVVDDEINLYLLMDPDENKQETMEEDMFEEEEYEEEFGDEEEEPEEPF